MISVYFRMNPFKFMVGLLVVLLSCCSSGHQVKLYHAIFEWFTHPQFRSSHWVIFVNVEHTVEWKTHLEHLDPCCICGVKVKDHDHADLANIVNY